MAYGSILGQNPTAQNTLYNNAQTSSIITANNVQGAIDQLFTSVSNGKQQIASAITDKGVSTSASDTFATMAENIGKISTGIDLSAFTKGRKQAMATGQTYYYNDGDILVLGVDGGGANYVFLGPAITLNTMIVSGGPQVSYVTHNSTYTASAHYGDNANFTINPADKSIVTSGSSYAFQWAVAWYRA